MAEMFNCVDIEAINSEFDRQAHDPVIHFYESFLAEYDPSLRKSRGVWYTPYPVVRFIVGAVDALLKTAFSLPQGLADHSFVAPPTATTPQAGVHRVQILDPATGTGTFLAETVRLIHESFRNQQGLWNGYVEQHLIPRINGFEILMASYAMAHLKLDQLLHKTGYRPTANSRLHIYLTDSLEEAASQPSFHFARWLSDEANEAARIKREAPVMVILGNPPYSGESSNKGKWIEKLIEQYKKDDTGKTIANTKWLNNDYVKFIRLGQHFIEKNGEGILAFITDNSFLDSLTFNGMRYNLMQTFDKIYILNLHGNSLKQETAPDGGKDENVFDIMQGVSINIFVKIRNV
jgi:predicted helicase